MTKSKLARTIIDKAIAVDLEDADDYKMLELLLLLLIFSVFNNLDKLFKAKSK